ncbi:MAG: HAMP domain-containing protein [Desulfatibacillum sp.]|nr:HAMP domain-containing protein [Desulfatibacillum sp.]
MQSRLSNKIIGAFLLLAFISIGLTVGLSRYYSYKNFRQYLWEKELGKIELIATAAAQYYSQEQGWEGLRRDHRQWLKLMASGRDEDETPSSGPVMNPRSQVGFPEHPPFEPPGRNMEGRPPHPVQPPGEPLQLGQRVSLLDAQKRRVQGARFSIDKLTLVPVNISGETVGWIGIAKDFKITHPLEVGFIRQQSKALFLIGGAILILSISLSMLLARSFLRPIRMLVKGTKEIAKHHFQVRIPVRSSDELGQLASDFNEMARQLEKYTQMQEQWISDISHELRTPLSVLIGSIEALEDGIRKPDAQTFAMLHAKALYINQLVNDLHTLSMTESNALKMNKTNLDIQALLIEVVNRFRERTEKSGLEVMVKNLMDPPSIIHGDPNRLTQVFSNLLENSLQHTDIPGTLCIGQEQKGDAVEIVFEDSAPGVPKEALPKIFDRLFRADPSRNADTGGSGLGLSICKSIIESHDGTIRAQNSSLGGVCIIITLPLAVKNSFQKSDGD